MEGNQYRDAAGRIVEAVGKDNILSATHCATRLRLIVKDKERIDEKKLQEIGQGNLLQRRPVPDYPGHRDCE